MSVTHHFVTDKPAFTHFTSVFLCVSWDNAKALTRFSEVSRMISDCRSASGLVPSPLVRFWARSFCWRSLSWRRRSSSPLYSVSVSWCRCFSFLSSSSSCLWWWITHQYSCSLIDRSINVINLHTSAASFRITAGSTIPYKKKTLSTSLKTS